jgi:hypothetical protein
MPTTRAGSRTSPTGRPEKELSNPQYFLLTCPRWRSRPHRWPFLCTTGDQDVETRDDRGLEELRGLSRERAQLNQVVQVVGLDDELADVDMPVLARDIGDDHVQPRPIGQDGVHEWAGQVDPPP